MLGHFGGKIARQPYFFGPFWWEHGQLQDLFGLDFGENGKLRGTFLGSARPGFPPRLQRQKAAEAQEAARRAAKAARGSAARPRPRPPQAGLGRARLFVEARGRFQVGFSGERRTKSIPTCLKMDLGEGGEIWRFSLFWGNETTIFGVGVVNMTAFACKPAFPSPDSQKEPQCTSSGLGPSCRRCLPAVQWASGHGIY